MSKNINQAPELDQTKNDSAVIKERTFRKNSLTNQLIQKYGVERLRELWEKNGGMYGASNVLSRAEGHWVPGYIIRYICTIYGWQRTIDDPNFHLVKAIINGKVKLGFYKHLIFGEKVHEVFQKHGIV